MHSAMRGSLGRPHSGQEPSVFRWPPLTSVEHMSRTPSLSIQTKPECGTLAGGQDIAPIASIRTAVLHPIVLFVSVWVGVALLYSLHLSELLIFKETEVEAVVFGILLPYIVAAMGVTLLHRVLRRCVGSQSLPASLDLTRLDNRLKLLFRIWLIASIFETVFSGGLPLVWLLEGSSKTYGDFGIPSFHGLGNSLIQAVAIAKVGLFLVTRKRRHLLVPGFVVAWSIVAITRNMMIVVLTEAAVATLLFHRIRLKIVLRGASALLAVVLLFGVIGDARSGADKFRVLARPTDSYPEWMPSGVLWVYIYLTTPINNLLYTMDNFAPLRDPLFPSTTALLFPSVVRDEIYGGKAKEAARGDLLTDAFNASTAFVSPYQDAGYAGIFLYSSLIGLLGSLYWRRNNLRDVLIYSVVAQCVIFTVFFNHLFNLPILGQIPWLYIIFCNREIRVAPGRKVARYSSLPAATHA
jgi:oligosaccharide repeat unit polymerase